MLKINQENGVIKWERRADKALLFVLIMHNSNLANKLIAKYGVPSVLLLIIFMGIFLRTYHFADWMKFGEEQARDAKIARNVVENHGSLPLLGPKAGDTKFKVGPAYYYFQSLSANVFGMTPDKLAYPDLFFSILTIPLLLFFLKKYFSNIISILLTALYAVSVVAVQNSRFAWNPNSIDFFVVLFLFSFLNAIEAEKQTAKVYWAMLTGIALGVGLQLHTTFLLIVPLVFLLNAAYVIKKKRGLSLELVLMVLGIIVFLNIPQIISEYQTGGENTRAFIEGILAPPQGERTWVGGFLSDASWQAQASAMFMTPFGNESISDYASAIGERNRRIDEVVSREPLVAVRWRLMLEILLTLAGYWALIRFLKKETDEKKKNFLSLTGLYITVSLLVLFPVAHDLILVLRYLFIEQFVPFVLLGLLAEIAIEKFGKIGMGISVLFVVILMSLNVFWLKKDFESFANNTHQASDETLGEETFVGKFIKERTRPSQQAYLVDEGKSMEHFIVPLGYFIDGKRIELLTGGQSSGAENPAFFSLQLVGSGRADSLSDGLLQNYSITEGATYGRLEIFALEPRR